MHELAITRLDNGSSAQILVVTSPCPEMTEDIAQLLGHKGEPWVWHIRQCLDGHTEGLDARFYLARVGGRLVSNATVFQNGALGGVAHVFTQPEFRRMGLARLLLDAALSEFARRGGRALVLSTGLESMPWRLYESFGFTGTCPEQSYGGMAKFLGDADWRSVLAGPAGEIRRADWRHYLGAQVLFGAPGPVQLRSILLPCLGARVVELGFILLKQRQQEGEAIDCWVIEGRSSAILGCALLGAHPIWGARGTRMVLDLYAVPSAAGAVADLLAAILEPCQGPVECYCDGRAEQQMDLLSRSGFRQEARFAGALRFADALTDLVVMTRA
jgi:GNAT superfamily N-acetyltransferase